MVEGGLHQLYIDLANAVCLWHLRLLFSSQSRISLTASRKLRHSLEEVRYDTGLLTEVFELLQIKVVRMNDKERDCALTVDEMSITPSIQSIN